MLTKITLENFKVFRHATEFPLAKINLLTGINGRGKSSLLQSLLLMRQSIEHNENTTELILNGNCVHLGTWEDVKNRDEEESNEIKISLNFINENNHHQFMINYSLLPQKGTLSRCKISKLLLEYKDNDDTYNELFVYKNQNIMQSFSIKDDFIEGIHAQEDIIYTDENGKSFVSANLKLNKLLPVMDYLTQDNHYKAFGNYRLEVFRFEYQFLFDIQFHYHYISADRIGARDFYEKDLNLNNNFITIEKTGKNVLDIISYHKTREINTSLYLGGENNLITQIGKWLGHILDATVAINLDDSNKFVNSFTYTINGKENLLPSNVGFGYSYILPIITAGLIANKGEILIVENPEAHLHPKAQSRLTEFLAKVAATGVQVFVESHSDHILNALRVCVKQQKIAANDVNVLFFSNDKITQEPKVSFPKIDEDGRIDVWEDDFFDEIDKSLMNLL
jgi:predicted ATPase